MLTRFFLKRNSLPASTIYTLSVPAQTLHYMELIFDFRDFKSYNLQLLTNTSLTPCYPKTHCSNKYITHWVPNTEQTLLPGYHKNVLNIHYLSNIKAGKELDSFQNVLCKSDCKCIPETQTMDLSDSDDSGDERKEIQDAQQVEESEYASTEEEEEKEETNQEEEEDEEEEEPIIASPVSKYFDYRIFNYFSHHY